MSSGCAVGRQAGPTNPSTTCRRLLQWLLLARTARRGEMVQYSRMWVRYGDLWDSFRNRTYWWYSIRELRKLALILVLVTLQVGPHPAASPSLQQYGSTA